MRFCSSFICRLIFLFVITGVTTTYAEDAQHTWSNLEYLYWWVQNSPINVPLITQNNNPSAHGFINQPGTQIIFGRGSSRDTFDFNGISGGRVSFGTWLNGSQKYGIEINAYDLPQVEQNVSASSINTGIPIINIPFYSVNLGEENVLVDRHPNVAEASDTFQSYGLDINGLYNTNNLSYYPITIIMGLRYVNINEMFKLSDAIIEIPSFPNSVLNVQDNFTTKNNFYGLQLGARTHIDYDNFICDLGATIAFGNNFEKLIINGQTNLNNTTPLLPMGLFAEPSNIGTHTRNQFAILPEIQAKIGYHFNRDVTPFFTYNFLYINNVIRPGNQIDRNINQTQNPAIGGSGVLVGPASPQVSFHNSSLWIQGISAGIEINFS